MQRKTIWSLTTLCSLLFFPLISWAGFNEALTAYQAKDFSTAVQEARQAAAAGDARGSFLMGVIYQSGQGVTADATEAAAWYEKAAKGGVASAFTKLAQLYARGEGVPKNPEKAIEFARRADQYGDPEGSLFLYLALTAGPLNYFDANRKLDQAKYQQLAKRPLSERALDTEARDALYRAAAKKQPLAEMVLALALGATVGDGNRERMLALANELPNDSNQALRNFERIAHYMEKLGQTYTTPQLFLDSQMSQAVAGMIQTCGIRNPQQTDKPAPPELIAIAISKPLSGAVFLPSNVSGNAHAYLIAGEWEESWTYRDCGKTANVTVHFTADGMGGAYMLSKQMPKLMGTKQVTTNTDIAQKVLSIKIGDDIATVRAKLATDQVLVPMPRNAALPQNAPDYNQGKQFLHLQENGVWVFFDKTEKVETIRLDEAFNGSVKGVHLGDSLSSVTSLLGQPIANPESWLPGTQRYRYKMDEYSHIALVVGKEGVHIIFITK